MKVWFIGILRTMLAEVFGEMLTAEQRQEKWLSADELRQQFGLSKDWVRRYGQRLPRVQVDHGAFVYPLGKIQKMFWDSSISNLGID